MGDINRRLKALRQSAIPPISLEKMAGALGMDSRQAYHFYERDNGFKQRYLPIELARQIAAVLSDRGVDADDVLALAGIEPGDSARVDLSASEQRWLDTFHDLSLDQRRLLQAMADQMRRQPDPGEHDQPGRDAGTTHTVHSGGPTGFRSAPPEPVT